MNTFHTILIINVCSIVYVYMPLNLVIMILSIIQDMEFATNCNTTYNTQVASEVVEVIFDSFFLWNLKHNIIMYYLYGSYYAFARTLIGANLSKPHASHVNGCFVDMYVYRYVCSYVCHSVSPCNVINFILHLQYAFHLTHVPISTCVNTDCQNEFISKSYAWPESSCYAKIAGAKMNLSTNPMLNQKAPRYAKILGERKGSTYSYLVVGMQ